MQLSAVITRPNLSRYIQPRCNDSMSILKKIDRVITAPHCSLIGYSYTASAQEIRISMGLSYARIRRHSCMNGGGTVNFQFPTGTDSIGDNWKTWTNLTIVVKAKAGMLTSQIKLTALVTNGLNMIDHKGI